jgi:pyruvate formate lyase activating enzyme
MYLFGFVKLTLIDFPHKVASVAFTQGCNLNCPFCHNPELITNNFAEKKDLYQKKAAEYLDFLKTRVGILEGVCITGGEPTLQADLIPYLQEIKNLGFLIKLDSNGTNPQTLEKILNLKLVDYLAMDIKSSQKNYHIASGKKIDLNKIQSSIDLITNSGIDYEFRTTVVPKVHHSEDFREIGNWLKGKHKYYLQEFRPEIVNNPEISNSNQKLDLKELQEILLPNLPNTKIRWNE